MYIVTLVSGVLIGFIVSCCLIFGIGRFANYMEAKRATGKLSIKLLDVLWRFSFVIAAIAVLLFLPVSLGREYIHPAGLARKLSRAYLYGFVLSLIASSVVLSKIKRTKQTSQEEMKSENAIQVHSIPEKALHKQRAYASKVMWGGIVAVVLPTVIGLYQYHSGVWPGRLENWSFILYLVLCAVLLPWLLYRNMRNLGLYCRSCGKVMSLQLLNKGDTLYKCPRCGEVTRVKNK